MLSLTQLVSLLLLIFSIYTAYEVGFILAIIWMVLHALTALFLLVSRLYKLGTSLLKRLSRQQVCSYLYYLVTMIIILFTIITFFSLVKLRTSPYFPSPCDIQSKACVMVSPWQKHRSERVEMKLPVTFIDTDVKPVIMDWLSDNSYDLISAATPAEQFQASYYHYSRDLWYGIQHDLYIEVSRCSDVLDGTRVMVQSESRLGFKDYHENIDQV